MIIQLPVPAQTAVIQDLERALTMARAGRLSGIALSYMADGEMFDIAEAKDYAHAVSLLGQSNMLRLDIMELVKRFREQTHP